MPSDERVEHVWTIGSYPDVGQRFLSMAAHVVDAVDVGPGDRVLDVACGTGNVAITAARPSMASYYAPDPEARAMLNLAIEDFNVELKNGAISNVGPPTKAATVKLYDVDSAEAREFGDKRVKFAFADDDGNEVEVALFPEDVREIVADVEALEADSPVFE